MSSLWIEAPSAARIAIGVIAGVVALIVLCGVLL
jgi:hypothetical protein